MTTRFIAYLLYGGRREYQEELAYSVLSALRFLHDDARDIRIAVISDRADLGFDLPVEHVELSGDEFAAWTQNGTYHHAAKVHALLKLIDHFDAPVALVDTDTYWLEHPARVLDHVSPAASVMHAAEGIIAGHPEWRPILDQIGEGRELAGVRVTPHAHMWNSGVIGVHPQNRPLVEQALKLLFELRAIAPVFNVEQFALGALLARDTPVTTAERMVRHYWGFDRAFVHVQIRRQLRGYSRDRMHEALRSVHIERNGIPRKRLRDQLASRLRARLSGWSDDYRFAYLAYRSAFGAAARDPDYANAWARTAVAALEGPDATGGISGPRVRQARRDFARLTEPRIHRWPWLRGDVKARWLALWQRT